MTLNITMGAPWGVFQCSDYRLTNPETGDPLDDDAGSKQLSIQLFRWTARLCFTGIASVGRYETRQWLSDVLGKIVFVNPKQRHCDDEKWRHP